MREEELLNVNGGSVSASLINSIARGVNTIFNLGRALGSATRRVVNGKMCPL